MESGNEMTNASIFRVLKRSALSSILLLCAWKLVFGQIRYSIPEELEHGAFVGKIGKDLGFSIEELSSRKFRLISEASKQYLDVNRLNGILFVNARINREQLCGQSDTCVLLMEAVAENPVEQYRIEIVILDINDNSPSFSNKEIRLEITESTMPGARFLLERAHDPDGVNNSIRTYQLTPNEHFTLDVLSRGNWISPELIVNNFLDREIQTKHLLLLTALDGGTPQRSGTIHISIIILDANDNPPVFDKSLYVVNVKENVPLNTLLIKLNATDMDEGQNAEIVYSFGSYNEPRINEIFMIDPTSGEINLKASLDFEEANVFDIDVQAKDGNLQPLFAHCSVRVQITDINDNAPDLAVNSIADTVPEDTPKGTLIALISVTDLDSNSNGLIDCSISHDLPFDLITSFQNSYRLVTNSILDRESIVQHNINIICNDRGIPPLSSSRRIVVNISDINDNMPRFTQPSFMAYVPENNDVDSSIGSVTALDLDIGRNSKLSYSILENHIQPVPALSLVYINSNDGSIYSKRSFDYEQLKSFQFHVRAQDAGLPSLSSDVPVQVIVLDQNDNPPAIIYSKRNTNIRVPRSADPGYLVTKIVASDADSGKNAQLFYQLNHASVPGIFKISRSSGEVRSVRRLKDSDAITHRLIIQVKDNGSPALSVTTTLTLTVIKEDTPYQPDFSEPHQDLKDTQEFSLYLIISLAVTSLILLVIIIVLVVAICPTSSPAVSGGLCSFAHCCCTKDLEYQSSIAQQQHKPDLHIFPSVLQVHGNGSLSDTYRYKIRSAPESAAMFFTALSPQMGRSSGIETRYEPQDEPGTRNISSDMVSNVSKTYDSNVKMSQRQTCCFVHSPFVTLSM
ncbi:protocadherin beta-15-like [Narcine bancroftii]|uniref:protocadherin beta-15-like n=1 Tax=Narcine bancroftii TaxID=1343680 RepID=UPI003831D7C4